jgi:CubicO group peptidase (beta-lactamase class C family)
MRLEAGEIVRALEAEPVSVPVAVGVSIEGKQAIGSSGDAVFRIASVTKPFVAALVLTVVQDELVDLDAPVTDYLPELWLPSRPVTLRELLSHQAGLEHEWSTPLADFGDSDDALERLARGAPVAAPIEPGRWFSYASAGFYLAAAVVQRVTGTTLEAALQERILDPLGLRDTSFEGDASLEYPRARRAGGGLYSNVPDLLAFAEHLLGGPGPLTRESLDAMATPQVAAPEGWYGLGLGIREVEGRRILEHGGSVPGFRALLTFVPDSGFAFAGLSSSDAGRKAIDRLRDVAFEAACGIPPAEPVPAPLDGAGVAAHARHAHVRRPSRAGRRRARDRDLRRERDRLRARGARGWRGLSGRRRRRGGAARRAPRAGARPRRRDGCAPRGLSCRPRASRPGTRKQPTRAPRSCARAEARPTQRSPRHSRRAWPRRS